MKKAQNIILALFVALSLFVFTPAVVFAGPTINPCPDGADGGGTDFGNLCDLDADQVGPLISRVVQILLIAAAIIALFFLIWGGIRWVTSGGDKAKVDEARKHIVAAIIGLIIAFLAFFILSFVLNLFGISLTELQLPQLTP